jgi:hypothetical protein
MTSVSAMTWLAHFPPLKARQTDHRTKIVFHMHERILTLKKRTFTFVFSLVLAFLLTGTFIQTSDAATVTHSSSQPVLSKKQATTYRSVCPPASQGVEPH